MLITQISLTSKVCMRTLSLMLLKDLFTITSVRTIRNVRTDVDIFLDRFFRLQNCQIIVSNDMRLVLSSILIVPNILRWNPLKFSILLLVRIRSVFNER